ncbi:hypothetical protein DFH06DRAFT_1128706 [Mycena polygramma]|nr:hypothetical protein DFH06DRAFT_1128706 [Mycena polygramma]
MYLKLLVSVTVLVARKLYLKGRVSGRLKRGKGRGTKGPTSTSTSKTSDLPEVCIIWTSEITGTNEVPRSAIKCINSNMLTDSGKKISARSGIETKASEEQGGIVKTDIQVRSKVWEVSQSPDLYLYLRVPLMVPPEVTSTPGEP